MRCPSPICWGTNERIQPTWGLVQASEEVPTPHKNYESDRELTAYVQMAYKKSKSVKVIASQFSRYYITFNGSYLFPHIWKKKFESILKRNELNPA